MSLGFRIAPEEVETLIVNASPSATAASVHLSEDGLSLVAFVVCKGSTNSFTLESLKRTVPGYMLPSTLHVVDRLPMNANDKVDHKIVALNRHQLLQSAGTERIGIAPQHTGAATMERSVDAIQDSNSNLKEVIAHLGKIWQDTLGLKEMPPQDVNFFDIGGHRYVCKSINRYPSEEFC